MRDDPDPSAASSIDGSEPAPTASDDRTAAGHVPPAVILVEPQLGENIGTAARAMANFGVTDLRLVSPRDGWPNEKARAAASRADHVIDAVRLYDSVEAAVADLGFVIATTRRQRDMKKAVHGPADGLRLLIETGATGVATGILFGRERSGLENEEVALADIIVTFPVDPTFASLNIAQSVLLMAYEWRRQATEAEIPFFSPERAPPADRGDLAGLWRQLVAALEPTGYFRPASMADKMRENILLVLEDAGWDKDQVKLLRGVVGHLARGPRRPDGDGGRESA